MSKSSASSSWLGAPPATAGEFAFANGDFFAEASGQNKHRRATVPELQTHFKSGNEKDHPAHWFEAQLVHYGLKSSKTKSVARMRLFDAVRAGSLAVPAHITMVEAQLKKEWNKADKDAKKAAGSAAAAKSTPVKKAAGTKRKADEVSVSVNVTVSSGSSKKTKTAVTIEHSSASKGKAPAAAKKAATPAKTKPTEKKTIATSAKKTSATPTKKPTTAATKKATATTAAKKTTATTTTKKATATAAAKKTTATAAKKTTAAATTARQTSNTTTGSAAQSERAPRTKQTARRGGFSQGPSRASVPSPRAGYYDSGHYDQDNDGYFGESPPPYSEFSHDYDDEDDDGNDSEPGDGLQPLGLLNGDYYITSKSVSEEWPHFGDDFDLTLTLDGTRLWGKFDLGVVEGIISFEERPWESSHDSVPFIWRGRENEGEILWNNYRGYMTFFGDGRIEGELLDRMNVAFRGQRAPGQGTRSAVDARSMKAEWENYSEEEYDRESDARWR